MAERLEPRVLYSADALGAFAPLLVDDEREAPPLGDEDIIVIDVPGRNDSPVVRVPATAPEPLADGDEYALPADTFEDPDGDELRLRAALPDGDALPSWLSFDATDAVFSVVGSADGTAVEPPVTVRVFADDGRGGDAFVDLEFRRVPPLVDVIPESDRAPVEESVPDLVPESLPDRDADPDMPPEAESDLVPEFVPERPPDLDADPDVLPEPELAPERDPEPVPDIDVDLLPEAVPELVPDPEVDVDVLPAPEPVPELEVDVDVLPELESELVPDPEVDVDVLPEPESELVPELEVDVDVLPEPESELVPELEVDVDVLLELESVPELEIESLPDVEVSPEVLPESDTDLDPLPDMQPVFLPDVDVDPQPSPALPSGLELDVDLDPLPEPELEPEIELELEAIRETIPAPVQLPRPGPVPIPELGQARPVIDVFEAAPAPAPVTPVGASSITVSLSPSPVAASVPASVTPAPTPTPTPIDLAERVDVAIETVDLASLIGTDPDVGRSAAEAVGLETAVLRHVVRAAPGEPDIDTVDLAALLREPGLTDRRALDGFGAALERRSDAVEEQVARARAFVGGSIGVASGLSVGYLIWLVRGGTLAGSMLSSLPAWRFVDPLPVLDGLGDDDGEDQESLESMVGDDRERTPPAAPPRR